MLTCEDAGLHHKETNNNQPYTSKSHISQLIWMKMYTIADADLNTTCETNLLFKKIIDLKQHNDYKKNRKNSGIFCLFLQISDTDTCFNLFITVNNAEKTL